MDKHQLESGMYCVPKDKEECLNIIGMAQHLIMPDGQYTKQVLLNKEKWPKDPMNRSSGFIPKAVQFDRYIFAFAFKDKAKQIPVSEFIQRLKGEHNE